MVNMEIKQEVIDLGPLVETTQSSSQSISSRSFLQRSVTSKVVVKEWPDAGAGRLDPRQSFRRTERVSDTVQIPVLGALFGNTEEQVDRTELIVLITPRVVENSQVADQVTGRSSARWELAPMIPAS